MAQFELLLDRLLDDGRVVVTNNSRADVPVGTRFNAFSIWAGEVANGEFQQAQVGEARSVALLLQSVEAWRKDLAAIPNGHSAAVRLVGGGIEVLFEQLQSKPQKSYLLLST